MTSEYHNKYCCFNGRWKHNSVWSYCIFASFDKESSFAIDNKYSIMFLSLSLRSLIIFSIISIYLSRFVVCVLDYDIIFIGKLLPRLVALWSNNLLSWRFALVQLFVSVVVVCRNIQAKKCLFASYAWWFSSFFSLWIGKWWSWKKNIHKSNNLNTNKFSVCHGIEG